MGAVAAESVAVTGDEPFTPTGRPPHAVGSVGLWATPLIPAKRRAKAAIVLKPSSFSRFHQALVRCKYRRLHTTRTRPGSKKGHRKSLLRSLRIRETTGFALMLDNRPGENIGIHVKAP